jgi:hypothetical protein
MTSSLLAMCQNAANDAGVTVPSSIVGNADPAAARLLQMARRTARDLAERANWTALIVENVFIANGTSDYLLPSDYRSLVSETMWDRSRFWRMRGAQSPQQWQMYKSSVYGRATIERRWRIRVPTGAQAGAAVQFEIDPSITGDVTSTFVYEYVSKNWCASAGQRAASAAPASEFILGTSPLGSGSDLGAGGFHYAVGDLVTLAGGALVPGGLPATLAITLTSADTAGVPLAAEIITPGSYITVPGNPVAQASTTGVGTGGTWTMSWTNVTQPDWAADTDLPLLDGDVMELGIIWRLLHRLGLAYDEEKDEFERRVDMLIARDGGTAALDLAPIDRYALIGPYNLPETGFGPAV